MAAIHALPTLALFALALIERLCDVASGSDGLPLPLHHRAALFLVAVAVGLWAAARRKVRRRAAVAVGPRGASILVLCVADGRPRHIAVIAVADRAGLCSMEGVFAQLMPAPWAAGRAQAHTGS